MYVFLCLWGLKPEFSLVVWGLPVCLFVFSDIFWAFVPLFSDRTAEEWTGNRGERGGMTRSKGPQCGIERMAAAARTKPLYMGHLLYQLSHWVPQGSCNFCGDKILDPTTLTINFRVKIEVFG